MVSSLAAASGWRAGHKGNLALDQAMASLIADAIARSANAIVGLHASTFGAHGGLTAGLGGDAVGVLLLGTAVTIEPDSVPDSA